MASPPSRTTETITGLVERTRINDRKVYMAHESHSCPKKAWRFFKKSTYEYKHLLLNDPRNTSTEAWLWVERGSKVIAAAKIIPLWQYDVLALQHMFVLPRFQGRGIGRYFVQRTIQIGLSNGLKEVRMDTHNPKAISFFEHVGFSMTASDELSRAMGEAGWYYGVLPLNSAGNAEPIAAPVCSSVP